MGDLFMFLLMLVSYFLPAIVALSRSKRNTGAIFACNLLLGWTVLGWIVSLIWALTVDSNGGNHGSSQIEGQA